MTEKQEEKERVRIVFQGQCKKLTARGVGLLGYELGSGETSEEPYVRISGNETSGTYSFEWIKLETIETILNERPEPDKPFNAKLFQKAFVTRSVNSPCYIAAALRNLGTIASSAENPTLLSALSFSSIKDRISKLVKEGVDLPDEIALAQAEKEKQRAEQSKSIKLKKTKPKTAPTKIGLVEDNPEVDEENDDEKSKVKRRPARKKSKTDG